MPDAGEAEAWREVLNELWRRSRDVLEPDQVFEAWNPPVGLGPIPVELIPRAISLIHAQRIAIANVRARKEDVSARLRMMRQLPQLFHGDIPVYVDRVS